MRTQSLLKRALMRLDAWRYRTYKFDSLGEHMTASEWRPVPKEGGPQSQRGPLIRAKDCRDLPKLIPLRELLAASFSVEVPADVDVHRARCRS